MVRWGGILGDLTLLFLSLPVDFPSLRFRLLRPTFVPDVPRPVVLVFLDPIPHPFPSHARVTATSYSSCFPLTVRKWSPYFLPAPIPLGHRDRLLFSFLFWRSLSVSVPSRGAFPLVLANGHTCSPHLVQGHRPFQTVIPEIVCASASYPTICSFH